MIQPLAEQGPVLAESRGPRSPKSNHIAGENEDILLGANEVFVLKEKRKFFYETRSCPVLPTANHVIVEVQATGLCGSDIHYWQHGEIGDFKVREPIVLGHESAGIVRRCGTGVRSLRPGDKIAIEPGIPCRTCTYCRGGKYNLCADVHFAATPPHDGTLSTYYTVPEDFCFMLPSNVAVEEGALLEPLSVAVHTAKLGKVTFGSSVLVMGAGPIGLLCCAVARAYGAVHVVAVDIVEERLSFARQYAATNTYQMGAASTTTHSATILSRSGVADGFDVVIDATGAEACIDTGLRAIKRGGIFVQAGLGPSSINFPLAQLCSKEVSYKGSFRYGPGDYKDAVTLLEHGRVNVKALITHRYDFTRAEEAFEKVAQRQGIKSIILGPNMAQSCATK